MEGQLGALVLPLGIENRLELSLNTAQLKQTSPSLP